jgi:hypothetical protein
MSSMQENRQAIMTEEVVKFLLDFQKSTPRFLLVIKFFLLHESFAFLLLNNQQSLVYHKV